MLHTHYINIKKLEIIRNKQIVKVISYKKGEARHATENQNKL